MSGQSDTDLPPRPCASCGAPFAECEAKIALDLLGCCGACVLRTMTPNPRQTIADALWLGDDEDSAAVVGTMLNALLPEPGAVVLVRHEDGTYTTVPVEPHWSTPSAWVEVHAGVRAGDPCPEPDEEQLFHCTHWANQEMRCCWCDYDGDLADKCSGVSS